MIILDNTNKSLEVILGEAKTTSDCDFSVSYVYQDDQCRLSNNQLSSALGGESDGTTNGNTAVTILSAPTSPPDANTYYQKRVYYISVYNNDSVQHLVTIRLKNSSSYRILFSATISPGSHIIYNED